LRFSVEFPGVDRTGLPSLTFQASRIMNLSGLKPILFLLFALQAFACQRFAHRFASVQTVCGVPRAADTHYVEFYSSQGERLESRDIIVENGVEISTKGCLVWRDETPAQSLIVRHRLKSEGLALRTQDLRNEPTLLSLSLRTFPYNPPKIICQNSVISSGADILLYQAAEGLRADAWSLHLDQRPQAVLRQEGPDARLLIHDWKDGRYAVSGTLTELYSPEQRRYPFSCELTVDRRPPQFSFTRTLHATNEWVASPGQTIEFPRDADDSATHVSLCLAHENESCQYQTLTDGRWVVPDRGVFHIQVKAIDAAGNESTPVKLTIRIHDATKIAGLRSELALIQRLVSEQNGEAAREHMRAVLKTFASLGTVEEKAVIQNELDAALFAVHLSPKELRLPKSEGSYLNWLTLNGQNGILLHTAGFLVLRDEHGAELQRFPIDPAAKISSRACIEGRQRSLLLKVGKDIVQITAKGLETVAQDISLDALQPTGSCRYRKFFQGADGSWTILDLVDGAKTFSVTSEQIWVLSPEGREPLLLTLNAGVYTTQDFDGTDQREHPNLKDLALDKILPDARLLALKKDVGRTFADVQVLHFVEGAFVQETAGLQVNANDASGNRSGSFHTLYRAVDSTRPQWYIHNANEPQFFRKIDLPTSVDPESMELGHDLIVSDASAVPGVLDLTVHNSHGTLISTLRVSDANQSRPNLVGVMGHRLLLNREDALVVMDPFPKTQLQPNRSPSRLGMQWGPYFDSEGQSWRFSRAPLQTHQASMQMEILSGPHDALTFSQPAGSTKALNRLVEKPLALWSLDTWTGTRERLAAFLQNQKNLMLQKADGTIRKLALPEAGDWLRIDIRRDGQELILVNRAGQAFKKSWQDEDSVAELLPQNVWHGCTETLSRKALDYAPDADLYVAIACQKILLAGQALSLDQKLMGTLAGVQITADGQALLVWTSETASIIHQKDGSWKVQTMIRPDLKNDALVLARWKKDQSLVLLSSRNGRIFLARVADGQLLEIRLPQGRPWTVDDMHFDESTQRVALLGPEGLLEFPDSVNAIIQELCSSTERKVSCVE
jgi:hypothetical protein